MRERTRLEGRIFGKWTVLAYRGPTRKSHYLCRCSCGIEREVDARSLRAGLSGSCGCIKQDKRIDLTGQTYGKLTVLERRGRDKNSYRWWVRCACGTEREMSGRTIWRGRATSCGCVAPQKTKDRRRALREMGVCRGTGFGVLLYNYRSGAIRRGLEWALTQDQFASLTQGNCFYCGCPPGQVAGAKAGGVKYTYNGVDRWDNTVGYILDNVRPCCRECNWMKGRLTGAVFLTKCRAVAVIHQ